MVIMVQFQGNVLNLVQMEIGVQLLGLVMVFLIFFSFLYFFLFLFIYFFFFFLWPIISKKKKKKKSKIDINECSTNNGGCHATLATCTNTEGSHTCTCKAGYSGDGVTCNGKKKSFTSSLKNKKSFNQTIDINECSTNNGGCSANAVCTNTVGSFNCACKAGYTGNGISCNGNQLFCFK